MSRHFEQPPTSLSKAQFVATFGGVYEHSPWVAEIAFDAGLTPIDDTVDGLARTLAAVVDSAGEDQQRELILAHPDLAGKAAVAGTLTESSTSEQASAGLDQCSAEEFDRFQRFNARYRARFDMPFIKAVRFSNRHEILAAFEQRLEHSPEQEFQAAIDEIHRIAQWRLEAMLNG